MCVKSCYIVSVFFDLPVRNAIAEIKMKIGHW